MSSLLDLFFAGTETTALTLSWAMLYLTFFSEAQEKLCEEINRVVGDSRLPRLSDDAQMPYTKAVVLEVLRMSSLLPLGVFRSTLDNVELCSYNIPKNTMVLANFYGAHHDQDYWGDPEVFRPDRFLSPDGKSIVKHDNFLPFSVGKRACVGEALAKNEIFLFLAFIFQRFNVSLDPSNVNPSLEPTVAFTLMPPDHKLVFSQRKQQQ
jgi:cytochrome P450